MPHRSKIPSYRLHKQSGHAIGTLPDGFGGRKDLLLGNTALQKAGPNMPVSWASGKPEVDAYPMEARPHSTSPSTN
jgi:hypothetical protein